MITHTDMEKYGTGFPLEVPEGQASGQAKKNGSNISIGSVVKIIVIALIIIGAIPVIGAILFFLFCLFSFRGS